MHQQLRKPVRIAAQGRIWFPNQTLASHEGFRSVWMHRKILGFPVVLAMVFAIEISGRALLRSLCEGG